MEKLVWWLKRCLECWDESIELIDSDRLKFYEEEEDWDRMWRALEMPIQVDDSGVFPGLSDYLVPAHKLD